MKVMAGPIPTPIVTSAVVRGTSPLRRHRPVCPLPPRPHKPIRRRPSIVRFALCRSGPTPQLRQAGPAKEWGPDCGSCSVGRPKKNGLPRKNSLSRRCCIHRPKSRMLRRCPHRPSAAFFRIAAIPNRARGGKHQSESERSRGIANEAGEFVPNRQHHFSYLAESCFKRASTASLPKTSSVTVTRTAGAEVSTLPIATTGSAALGSIVTPWPSWATIIAR